MTGAEKDVGPPMQCVLRGVGPARISGAQRVSCASHCGRRSEVASSLGSTGPGRIVFNFELPCPLDHFYLYRAWEQALVSALSPPISFPSLY